MTLEEMEHTLTLNDKITRRPFLHGFRFSSDRDDYIESIMLRDSNKEYRGDSSIQSLDGK